MADKRVVLVTGVAGFWGGRVAARLIDRPDRHVIGLDDDPPEEEIKGLDFIQANIHNPLLVELLKQEEVDTVCHLTFLESLRPTEAAFRSASPGMRDCSALMPSAAASSSTE